MLCEVASWCSDNVLVLNNSKYKSMLIHCDRSQVDKLSLNVSLNGQVIDQINSVKFLGVMVDDTLT